MKTWAWVGRYRLLDWGKASGEYFSESKCLSEKADTRISAGPQVWEKSMKFYPTVLIRGGWLSRAGCATTLALCLGSLVLAHQQQPQQQQDQPIQSRDQVPQPVQPQAAAQPQQQPQEQTPPPRSTQKGDNRPPIISVDRLPQRSPQNRQQNQGQYSEQNPSNPNGSPNGPYDQYAPPPSMLTIPPGTVLMMRLNEPLSSDRNQIGDQFSGVLEQPIVVNGWVVARRGQVVMGQVKSVKKAGRIKGVSQLGVELTDLTLVNGEQAPILTELWRGSGGTSHGADAATIGGGTLLGAIIGSAADWETGAAIGAGAGAAAGVGAVLLTRGRPIILEPESQLSFRLVDPVKVDTMHSQQAFYPVSQDDFGNGRGARPRLRRGSGYYGTYGPCGYYNSCYGYPGFVGIYPEFGWWGDGFYDDGFYDDDF